MFPLVGVATALISMVVGIGATTAAVGALTGIGFIGSALVFRGSGIAGQILPGVTTAAGLSCAAAIGVASDWGLCGRPLPLRY
ncbi:putative membrane protein YhiD involved in acid resistance [Catenulispora sp. GP43]